MAEYLSGMSESELMVTRRKAGIGFAPESLVVIFAVFQVVLMMLVVKYL